MVSGRVEGEHEERPLTNTENSGRSARGCCRTCSRWSPSSASPCWLGSGSARCTVPFLVAAARTGPSCRSDLTGGLRSSGNIKRRSELYKLFNDLGEISGFRWSTNYKNVEYLLFIRRSFLVVKRYCFFFAICILHVIFKNIFLAFIILQILSILLSTNWYSGRK